MPKVKPKWERYLGRGRKRLSGVSLRSPCSATMVFGDDTGVGAGKVEVVIDTEKGLVGVRNGSPGNLTAFPQGEARSVSLMVRGVLLALNKSFLRGPLPWSKEGGMIIVDCSGLPDREE